MNEDRWSVSLAPGLITVTEPDGTRVEADIEDLVLIRIRTNDSGPMGADVWWVFEDTGEIILCAYPQGAAGEDAALDWMMALPGFDHEQMIAAMASTGNADFTVWRRA
jgi:hypothetical protein